MGDCYIIRRGNRDRPGNLPAFIYTGEYELIDEGMSGEARNWSIRFLTSGSFRCAKDMVVEMWLSGGMTSTMVEKTLTARYGYAVVSGDDVPERTKLSFHDINFGSVFSTTYINIRNAR